MSDLASFLDRHAIEIRDMRLVHEAVTHISYANEAARNVFIIKDNQRLEYLGDSVLDLIISEYLYKRFPQYPEGNLARLCSTLVCEETLARIAQNLGLGAVMCLGKGEAKLGGRHRQSNLADCLEAFIAALYLDQGLSATQKYVLEWFREEFQVIETSPQVHKDAKSHLQEITQKCLQEAPAYEEVSQSGPAHRKLFIVRVLVKGREYGRGSGYTLKKAEQDAANQALKRAGEIELTARR